MKIARLSSFEGALPPNALLTQRFLFIPCCFATAPRGDAAFTAFKRVPAWLDNCLAHSGTCLTALVIYEVEGEVGLVEGGGFGGTLLQREPGRDAYSGQGREFGRGLPVRPPVHIGQYVCKTASLHPI